LRIAHPGNAAGRRGRCANPAYYDEPVIKRTGFTLVELMVAMAVLVILLLAALPGYSDKLVREQVLEALPLADLARPPVELAWRLAQVLPADNTAAGLPAPEKIVNQRVSAVTVEHGAVHIRFGNQAHKLLQGKVLTVRPAGVEDARIVPLTWLCGAAAVPEQMTVQGENRTDVPAAFLPRRCR
jgi:type IV pilus assembly protein PilA